MEWVDPLGLASCPKGREAEKNERRQRHHSTSGEYDKHTKASSVNEAKSKSSNGGAAQYWGDELPDKATESNVTAFRNKIEKEGLRNGVRVPQDGGSDYYVYDAGRTIGYNEGKATQFMRVEVTKNPNPEFHGHPISEGKYNSYLKGAN
ncbi:hypothetical protein [uncultured Shewanella sp.]|uniref:hypothetical protein n=1 Tax=uncultured Shewanella sp. TaxID=173975 RepID=UPI00261DB973|nr:hypothetical protein [uncultured Shewanella sp.]